MESTSGGWACEFERVRGCVRGGVGDGGEVLVSLMLTAESGTELSDIVNQFKVSAQTLTSFITSSKTAARALRSAVTQATRNLKKENDKDARG